MKEVTQRCKVMAAFHRDELSKLAGSAGDPFNGIAVDLNALGALGLCTLLHCCLAFSENVHNDDDDVSFYNSTTSSWTLATPRTTWES